MFLLGPKVPIRSKSSYWARSYWVQKFLLGAFLLGSPTNLLDSKIVANQRDSGSYWARSYWAHPLYKKSKGWIWINSNLIILEWFFLTLREHRSHVVPPKFIDECHKMIFLKSLKYISAQHRKFSRCKWKLRSLVLGVFPG